MPYKDPQAQKAAQRRSYERLKEDVSESRKRRRAERRAFVDEVKLQTGCERCGYSRSTAALDFHHLGDKDQTVSRLVLDCRSFDVIREEISKCIVLCANCHREEHNQAAIV